MTDMMRRGVSEGAFPLAVTPSQAQQLKQLLSNKNLWGTNTPKAGQPHANNIQHVLITGTITIEEIDLYTGTIVRLNAPSLAWDSLADVLVLAANGEDLTVGQILLGYGFGYHETAFDGSDSGSGSGSSLMQVFVVSCCGAGGSGDIKWYCLIPPDLSDETCFNVSGVDLASMIDAGYSVSAGPYDTEDECLAVCNLPPVSSECCPTTLPARMFAHFENVTGDCIGYFAGLVIELRPLVSGWSGYGKIKDIDGAVGGYVWVQMGCQNQSEDEESPDWQMTMDLRSTFCGGNYPDTPYLASASNCTTKSFTFTFADGTAVFPGNIEGGANCSSPCGGCVGSFEIVVNTDSTDAVWTPYPDPSTNALIPCAPGSLPTTLYYRKEGTDMDQLPDFGTLTFRFPNLMPPGGYFPYTWGAWATPGATLFTALGITLLCDTCGPSGMKLYACFDPDGFPLGATDIASPDEPSSWAMPINLTFSSWLVNRTFITVSSDPIIAGTEVAMLEELYPVPDGSTTVFCTMHNVFSPPTIYMNGLIQSEGASNDYVYTSGNCITYNTPPLAGDEIKATYVY